MIFLKRQCYLLKEHQKQAQLKRPALFASIFLFLLTSSLGFASSAPNCSSLWFNTTAESSRIDSQNKNAWRPAPDKNVFMNFRANAPHLWNWLKNQNAPLLKYRGSVVGDPHLLNFGAIFTKKKTVKFGFIDADDSGVSAPFIGDVLRLLNGARASGLKLTEKEVFDAYLDGLINENNSRPDFLDKLENNAETIYSKKQTKFLNENTTNLGFSKESAAQPIDAAADTIKTEYKKMKPVFERLLTNYSIIDVGTYIKNSGGSQGMIRFWYLVEANGQRQIIEFKQESTPATASFASDQKSWTERFTSFTEYFRPENEPYGPYSSLTAMGSNYLIRLKEKPLIQFDPAELTSPKDIDMAREWTLYMARKLGYSHSQQPESIEYKFILNTDKEAQKSVLELSSQYYLKMLSEISEH